MHIYHGLNYAKKTLNFLGIFNFILDFYLVQPGHSNFKIGLIQTLVLISICLPWCSYHMMSCDLLMWPLFADLEKWFRKSFSRLFSYLPSRVSSQLCPPFPSYDWSLAIAARWVVKETKREESWKRWQVRELEGLHLSPHSLAWSRPGAIKVILTWFLMLIERSRMKGLGIIRKT